MGLRRELAGVFDRLRGVHVQIGTCYDYASVLDPATVDLVRALKRTVDPDDLISPGTLGR